MSRYYIDRNDEGDLVPGKVNILSPQAKEILRKATGLFVPAQPAVPEEDANHWTNKFKPAEVGLLDDGPDSEDRLGKPEDFQVPVVEKKKGYSRSLLYSTPQEDAEPEEPKSGEEKMPIVPEEEAEHGHEALSN